MRKKQKRGESQCSRICYFLIWSKRTSKSSIFNQRKRSMKMSSRRSTSTKCRRIRRLTLYADRNSKNEMWMAEGGSISEEGVAITPFARGQHPHGGQIMEAASYHAA